MKTPFLEGWSRRRFLQTGAAALGAALLGAGYWLRRGAAAQPPVVIPGQMVGANHAVGHLLRNAMNQTPASATETDVAIIGGGMSGLTAGWELLRQGIEQFQILELEKDAGGNSSYGQNAASAYPWGAHYVPLPDPENQDLMALFQELGVITGFDEKKLPLYNEYYLCFDPQDRLFIHGRWQEGIVPQIGLPPKERRQVLDFLAEMERLRQARGRDGKRAFAIPVAHSSADETFTALDQITMRQWLDQRGWTNEYLRWYVNYCCRDDFGATLEQISAWAGIHYFASRNGQAANAQRGDVLTWPEGNGWLVKQLKDKLKDKIQTQKLVFRVANTPNGAEVDYIDAGDHTVRRLRCKQAIVAAPQFVAQRIVQTPRPPFNPQAFGYAPWLVANLTLTQPPLGEGYPLAWDNVAYNSPSLGYIYANHQNLTEVRGDVVLTYYLPLTHLPPPQARAEALKKNHADWTKMVLADMEKMHRGITPVVKQIDVMVWGHGMIQPTPGFLWGKDRPLAARSAGAIHFAHTDLSGLSIFEEALYQGVGAARRVSQQL